MIRYSTLMTFRTLRSASDESVARPHATALGRRLWVPVTEPSVNSSPSAHRSASADGRMSENGCMVDFRARAQRFVEERFPIAEASFLGGSAATGRATESSDLDILVVLPEQWKADSFVETTDYEGQLVEVFVYGRDALQNWLIKGREGRRPVLDKLIGEGIALTGGRAARDLIDGSRRVLDHGPADPDPAELGVRAYSLSAVLDDLVDVADPGERFALKATVWREAAELALLIRRRWLGTGKWLFRELLVGPDEFGLVAWQRAATIRMTF